MLLRLRLAQFLCEQVRLIVSGGHKIQLDAWPRLSSWRLSLTRASRVGKCLALGQPSSHQRQRWLWGTHQRRKSWSTQCLEYCIQMQCLFGGLTESVQLCLGGGGHHARMLLWGRGECRTPIVERVAGHTFAVFLACYVVSIREASQMLSRSSPVRQSRILSPLDKQLVKQGLDTEMYSRRDSKLKQLAVYFDAD